MSAGRSNKVRVGKGRQLELILSPVITEKSTQGSEHNQISFRVPLSASKPEIKAAVEGLFDVKVTSVNTLRQKGKVKKFRGRLGKRPDVKKAIITLAEGEIVDVTAKI